MKKHILLFSLLILALSLAFTGCDVDETTPPSENQDTTYTIQYTDEGGNHTINVKNGEVYSIPSIPQKTGYEFLGLFDMEEGGTQFVSKTGNSLAPYAENGNLTLYPQFKAKEYTIVLDYQGADVTGARQINVHYGDVLSNLPMNLSINNKTFTGWYTEPNKGGKQIADKFSVNPLYSKVTERNFDLSDADGYICLYAGFKYEEFTVTLCVNESIAPEDVIVEWGTPISAVQCETRLNGLAVLSWSKTRNDTELKDVFTGRIEADVVLYACEFAPVIEFNPKGGEPVAPIVTRAGNTIYLPTPVRENYTFMGWYEMGGNQFTGTAMPSESTQLMAKWQANIVLDENGGTDVEDVSLPKGAQISLPTPERAGYIFAGWYDQSGNKYENTAMPEDSIKLTAKYWKVNNKKVVLINDSTTSSNSQNCPYISQNSNYQNYTTNFIDVGDLYNSGMTTIKLTAHYNVKMNDYSFSKISESGSTPKTHMAWYSASTASDAYKLWSYSTTHPEHSKYFSATESTTINLTSTGLYIARWGSWGWSNYSTNAYYIWTDFWVEIEYPDMSNLY